MSVFEANSNKFYTLPKYLRESTWEIPSPEKWAIIVSPDKSLPEFSWSIVILVSFLVMMMSMPIANKFLKSANFKL